METEFLKELQKYNLCVRTGENLNKYTTLNIGGPAKYFVFVNNISELGTILTINKSFNQDLFVIGAGSNILIADEGFDGVVIKLKEEFCQIQIQQNKVVAYAGVMLPMLIKTLIDASLSGLEELFGIPGTVGGGIIMNAGTKTATISDTLEYVEVMSIEAPEKGIIKLTKNEINFGYRTSGLENKFVVVKCVFNLKEKDSQILKKRVNEVLLERMKTQPLGTFNVGCVFKNPYSGGVSSAKLIEECGLKGYSIGEAYISEKHANFIINRSNAKAKDFLELMNYVRKVVKEKFNIDLEPEIKIVGMKV